MLTSTSKTDTAKFKELVLQPIISRWNKTIGDDWEIRPSPAEGHVRIVSFTLDSMHGSLLSDISGVCHAFYWTWAIYAKKGLIEVDI